VVDLPDDAPREDAVLMERDQLAEWFGSEAIGQYGRGWTVAFNGMVRDGAIRRASRPSDFE
jgi:hypothetical protein